MEPQPVRRVENAGQGESGKVCAENRRDRDAVQSGCQTDEGVVNDTLSHNEE